MVWSRCARPSTSPNPNPNPKTNPNPNPKTNPNPNPNPDPNPNTNPDLTRCAWPRSNVALSSRRSPTTRGSCVPNGIVPWRGWSAWIGLGLGLGLGLGVEVGVGVGLGLDGIVPWRGWSTTASSNPAPPPAWVRGWNQPSRLTKGWSATG